MTSAPGKGTQPTPALLFETLRGYQHSFAIKTAVELDLFTTVARTNGTLPEIAKGCSVPERSARILCDHFAVLGFLSKNNGSYHLTPDSATFLDSRSPAYMGKAVSFLLHAHQFQNFQQLTETIRKGVPARDGLEPDDPMWVEFARGMAPMMFPAAQAISQYLKPHLAGVAVPKVLDIAASHGTFGIAIAQQSPNAQIYALDWANVLQVARENARKAGVSDRHHLIPGSAFDAELGKGYDAVLITNFLHHFDSATNETLLRRFFAAMNPGGQLVILEFVPDADRLTPPPAAMFSLIMLANTEGGDAYTFAQFAQMCSNAGFKDAKQLPIEGSAEALVVAQKP